MIEVCKLFDSAIAKSARIYAEIFSHLWRHGEGKVSSSAMDTERWVTAPSAILVVILRLSNDRNVVDC